LDQAAKERGFKNTSAFIRVAIEKEVAPGNDVRLAEERAAANFDRLAAEVHRLRNSHQALFAFLDSLAKIILTCVPEPAGEAYPQAVARAKLRYERFIKSVGRGMVGESGVTFSELTEDADR
jgi:hypothetical protein